MSGEAYGIDHGRVVKYDGTSLNTVPPYPAPSPAAEPPDGQEFIRQLTSGVFSYASFGGYEEAVRHVAAALAPLLDRAAKAEAAVARVEALAEKLIEAGAFAAADDLHRALDGAS